jgi:hypothetical protein
MDEIEITLTISDLSMLSNCSAWSMVDRLATLKNSAKLRRFMGGWRYEPRQVRAGIVCTAGRSKAVSPSPHTGFLTAPPYSTLGYQPNGLWEKWLGNDDSLRMHRGRDLLQLSISVHDPMRKWSMTAGSISEDAFASPCASGFNVRGGV